MHTDIGDRVRDLKETRSVLAAEIYNRNKTCIAGRLKRLLPAGPSNDISIIKDANGQLFTESADIARILTTHSQTTFDAKDTNDQVRSRWLDRVRQRYAITLSELLPTTDDVAKVFANLHDSAAGPDGIPMGIYKQLLNISPALFRRLVSDIINGVVAPGADFNHAILCRIPKSADEQSETGVPVYIAANTRPLSIVDAANRIVAAIMNASLERCIGANISKMQRGFVSGRQMLMNIIEVDTAAQKISVRSTYGAIILFDFRHFFRP